ncbi:MAG: restriction endonuclease subunit R, partial [Rhodovibrionaceae bacterium]
AKMTEDEFAVRKTARSFEIDLDGKRVTYQFASEEEQLTLDVDVEGWTQEALARWLDRQVRQPDIKQGELLRWLNELLDHLNNDRGMHIAALMRCKFILARKVKDKLDSARREERESVYQRHLFAPEAKVEVSFENGFAFKDGMYADQRRYRGRWRPRKHFLGADQLPTFDGSDDGEEIACAQALDSMAEVEFWIRNVARHQDSFWLPTARGRFYPDFVAQLTDGRHLVVEYKGEHLAGSPETAEKRTIGQLWQEKSGGKGVFVMAQKEIDSKDVRQQLLAAI